MRLLPEVVYAKGWRTLKKRGDLLGCLLLLSTAYAAISTVMDITLHRSSISLIESLVAGDPLFGTLFISSTVLYICIIGITIKGVSEVFRGEMRWRVIIKSVLLSGPRLLVAILVLLGVLVGIFGAFLLLSAGTGSLICLCLGVPAGLLLLLYAALRLSLVLQWILLGEEGVITSFMRSWSMTSGRVGFMLVLHIPLYIVITVTSILRPIFIEAASHMNILDHAFLPVLLIAGLMNFLNVLFAVLLESALTVAYHEIRPSWEEKVRREMEREMSSLPREDYSWV